MALKAESPHVCRVSEIWPRPEKDLVLELAFEQMNEQRNNLTNKKMNQVFQVIVILIKGQSYNVTLLFKRCELLALHSVPLGPHAHREKDNLIFLEL